MRAVMRVCAVQRFTDCLGRSGNDTQQCSCSALISALC
jgi:hypothetical protein